MRKIIFLLLAGLVAGCDADRKDTLQGLQWRCDTALFGAAQRGDTTKVDLFLKIHKQLDSSYNVLNLH
jgi:hypothetical protein